MTEDTDTDTATATDVVRPYEPGDAPHVRRIFRQTLAMGRPVDFEISGHDRYEYLCLGWFLSRGAADIGILQQSGSGTPCGYVLVCTDLPSYHRWAAAVASRWAIGSAVRIAAGRVRGADSRFHGLRLLDGWHALRHSPSAPMPALVHMNLDPGARGALAGRALARYADERCRAAGLPGWFGEVNARGGRRLGAFRAIGLDVVHQSPNRTLSWLLGEPVVRLTVVHRIAQPIRIVSPCSNPATAPR